MKKIFVNLLLFCFISCLCVSCGEPTMESYNDDKKEEKEQALVNTLCGTWIENPKQSDVIWVIVSIGSDELNIYEYDYISGLYTRIWKGSYSEPKEPFYEYSFSSLDEDGQGGYPFNYSNGILSFRYNGYGHLYTLQKESDNPTVPDPEYIR